jgi:hypothetical protein
MPLATWIGLGPNQMLVADFLLMNSDMQVAAFMLPMLVAVGVMFLMMMLFAPKADNPTAIDMNTPSIQLQRGGIVPVVHGWRRIGCTYAWVGNRYAIEESVGGPGKSIAEGTLVESKNGPVPIESLKPGDKIWTRNKKGKRKLGRVKSVSDRVSNEIIRICHTEGSLVSDEKVRTIDVTPDHFMWIVGPRPEKRWIQARDIHPGDEFELFSGKRSTVRSVDLRKTNKRVLCPRMGMFSNKNFFAGDICVHNDWGGPEITQTIYFESAWHLLACGPVNMIGGIWENGKMVAGPISSEDSPSGTTISLEDGSKFNVYWGHTDATSSAALHHGNCEGSNPAQSDPILKNFCQTGGEGKQSCWPNVCMVVWQTRRLGSYPRWPQVEYEIFSQASGQAQMFACGFSLEDEGYCDGGCSCGSKNLAQCWGINPAMSLFKILTGPYPTGLSIPGERMDYWLFKDAAEHIRENEKWNSNVLIQAGHEYHRVVAELLTDMGAVLIEREGFIGPKIIRKGLAVDEPIPLLTGDVLQPPLDEISRSHISSMNESVQFKFHQRSINYRQNTIDIDNQESVASGEYRRKTTSAEMATITSWYSATTVANRRSYEAMVEGSTMVVNGDRGLREIRPGSLVDVANVGKFRVTGMTPDFDSIGVKLELTLDPYSVGEITLWDPDDGTVIPPIIEKEADISQDFFAIDLSLSAGEEHHYRVLPFVIRAHQVMTNHQIWWNPDDQTNDATIMVGNTLPCPGGVVIYKYDGVDGDRQTWGATENIDDFVSYPCVIAFYANGDQFNVPTSPPADGGSQHVIAAKVWEGSDEDCDCEADGDGLSDATINFELASVSHFEDLDQNNTKHGKLYDTAIEYYNDNVEHGLLPSDMRLMVPVMVGRGTSQEISFVQDSLTYYQGGLRSSPGNAPPQPPFPRGFGQGNPPEMGSRVYVQRVSTLLLGSIDLADLVPFIANWGYGDTPHALWEALQGGGFGLGRFKAVPCLGADCVPIADVDYSSEYQSGDNPYSTLCEIQGDSPCVDPKVTTHAGEGGGFFTQLDQNLLFGSGDSRSFGGGNSPPSNGMIKAMRVGGLHGDYGSSTGVNVPTNGGLVEHTESSSTVDVPDQGFMGTLDGYYRIPQGDHTTTSSSAPTPQMIGIQWSYMDPSKSVGKLGFGGTDVQIPSDVYFKVRLQGAGVLENDVRRLPQINEIPDYSESHNEWKTWIEFEEWTLGSSQFDHRMGMTSIVTFALPRAREKTLLARYLNTNESQAVSVMVGLGGRNRTADVAAVKQPRCRFLIEYYRKGRVVGTATAYVRAVGTDGATNYPSDTWW